jgi:hypothetical protein
LFCCGDGVARFGGLDWRLAIACDDVMDQRHAYPRELSTACVARWKPWRNAGALARFLSIQGRPKTFGDLPARIPAKPRQSLPRRLRQAPGTMNPRTLSEAFQNYRIRPLQRRSRVTGLNTSMTQPEFLLVADTVTDFIMYPTSDELRQSPDDPLVIAKARRAVTLYFHLLQATLAKHGHEVLLDRLDHDPDIGWLIHYRARDPVTITMLHDIAAGDHAPSDPVELGFLVAQVTVGESLNV